MISNTLSSWLIMVIIVKNEKNYEFRPPARFRVRRNAETQHNASEKEICFLYSVIILEHNNGAFF